MLQDSTLLSIAQEYVSLGFKIFPVYTINAQSQCSCNKHDCRDPGKHPKTAHGFKDASDDPERIRQWFANNDCNIGIATGEPSGIWVLDDDDVQANKHITELLPATWTVQTGSGNRQYFFRMTDETKDLKNAQGLSSYKLDVRATGGYVVAPPSKHASGGTYSWIRHPSSCPLADTPDWLVNLCPKRDSETMEEARSTEPRSGSRSPLPPSSSDPVDGTFHVVGLKDRAKDYLASCEPAISGRNGHGKTFGVVSNVVELFGDLGDDDLLECLADWNSRCLPPWSEKNLRHKLKDARRKTGTERRVDTHSSPDDIEGDDESVDDCRGRWTLGADAFHGLIGEIVQTVAPETEADPVGVLVSLLTAFGSAIGKGPSFSVGAGTHHANLFSAIVGDTASGKGQAWSIASRLMKEADPDWHRDCLSRGLSSGEGFVERLSDEESDDPLHVPSEKRLLCLETELARPITAMRREGNTLSPILRSAWDCDALEVMTRGKSKLKATNAFASILAHITADELQNLLSGSIEVVNGFGNRFLWCNVRCQKWLPHGGNISVLNGFGERLRLAIAKAKTIRQMKRSPEADRLWEAVYPELKRPRKGAYGRATDRGAPQVVRLSMLYALADRHPIISVDHLKAALAVWRYCDQSARLLFGEDDFDADPVERRICEIVAEAQKTKTEIRQRLSSKARLTYSEALDSLVQKKRITLRDGYYSLNSVDAGRLDFLDADRNEVQRPKSPESPESTTSTESKVQNVQSPASSMTLGDLFDWRNAHGIEFLKNDRGEVWVSPHQTHLLTDPIRSAITVHASHLADLATEVNDTTLSADGQALLADLLTQEDKPDDDSSPVDGEDFLAELDVRRNVPTLEETLRKYRAEQSTSA